MSQMSVATTVAKRSTEDSRRTSLRVVTPEEQAGSAWFPVLCVALLLAGLGAVLGLNTAMAQDSFEVTALEAKTAKLADTEDSLTHAINGRSSPQRLATKAGDMGMVPAGSAAFIDVDKGEVLGVATAAEKPDGFTVDAARTATVDESTSDSSTDANSSAQDTKKTDTTTDAKQDRSPATKSPATKDSSTTSSPEPQRSGE